MTNPDSGRRREHHSGTDNRDSIIVYDDGPGDTTVRPTRPDLLGDWPRPLRRPPPPPASPPEPEQK